MNHYITGAVIKQLREQKHFTQAQLAEKLCVSDKAVSKWETGEYQT
nr:helix-turn-helix transcriptional regulator [uncultured Agathobaculum sp.]